MNLESKIRELIEKWSSVTQELIQEVYPESTEDEKTAIFATLQTCVRELRAIIPSPVTLHDREKFFTDEPRVVCEGNSCRLVVEGEE